MTLSNQFMKMLPVTVMLGCCSLAAWAQTNPAQPPAKPKTSAKPAAAAIAPAKTTAKPAAKTLAKNAAAPAKTAAKPVVRAKTAQAAPGVAATSPGSAAPEATPAGEATAKRDPFVSLIDVKKEGGSPEHLPPGKAGLVVATVRIDGVSSSPNGMIAVVSNPEQHVYFIREGDHVYDGDVEKISADGVTFHEVSKDAFGKPVERTVTKRIYPSAGE